VRNRKDFGSAKVKYFFPSWEHLGHWAAIVQLSLTIPARQEGLDSARVIVPGDARGTARVATRRRPGPGPDKLRAKASISLHHATGPRRRQESRDRLHGRSRANGSHCRARRSLGRRSVLNPQGEGLQSSRAETKFAVNSNQLLAGAWSHLIAYARETWALFMALSHRIAAP